MASIGRCGNLLTHNIAHDGRNSFSSGLGVVGLFWGMRQIQTSKTLTIFVDLSPCGHGSAPDAESDEIKLEEIVDRGIVRKLDDSGFIDPHHDLATRVRSLEIFSHDRGGRKEK
jgi:hypothetical protein